MMSNRYAIIANGIVANVVLWDGQADWSPPAGTSLNPLPDDSPVSTGYAFDGASFTAPAIVAPVLTPAQQRAAQVAAAFATGLTVSSTSVPALNGTYSVDAAAQFNIGAVTNYVTVNNDFPGGVSAYPWPDAAGGFHVFPSVAVFKEWATAIADYVARLEMYQAGAEGASMPSPTVTIS